jgi:16S rRNA (cytosine1402-N4)-methyltransferase
MAVHESVMVKEVLEALAAAPGKNFIDATVGEGGHAEAILKATSFKQDLTKGGKLLGIDRDPEILKQAKKRLVPFNKRVVLRAGKASQILNEIVAKAEFGWQGILFDLGLSTWHLEKSGRGFSFKRDEPLDMRYNAGEGCPARELLNTLSKKELKAIFARFGQERFAGTIASRVVEIRTRKPFKTIEDFLEAIKSGMPTNFWRRPRRLHPATRVFQALRIAVNQELDELSSSLKAASSLLARKSRDSRGERRLVVITFHSLERRVVASHFQYLESRKLGQSLYKRPRRPSLQEINLNIRSRSAELHGFSFI